MQRRVLPGKFLSVKEAQILYTVRLRTLFPGEMRLEISHAHGHTKNNLQKGSKPMDDMTMIKAHNRIRAKLCGYCMTNQWLMNEPKKGGVTVNKSSLSATLPDGRKGAKLPKIIERYGRCYDEPR